MSNVPRVVLRHFPIVKRLLEARHGAVIDVTSKDVNSAKRMKGDACAMAKAICRQTHADGALVGLGYTYIIKGNTATKYVTSAPVQREITSFDRHHDFAPGTYKLSPLPQSQTRKAKKAYKAKNHGNSPSRHAKPVVHKKTHKKTVRVRDFRAAMA
jgi:hypothetical protein